MHLVSPHQAQVNRGCMAPPEEPRDPVGTQQDQVQVEEPQEAPHPDKVDDDGGAPPEEPRDQVDVETPQAQVQVEKPQDAQHPAQVGNDNGAPPEGPHDQARVQVEAQQAKVEDGSGAPPEEPRDQVEAQQAQVDDDSGPPPEEPLDKVEPTHLPKEITQVRENQSRQNPSRGITATRHPKIHKKAPHTGNTSRTNTHTHTQISIKEALKKLETKEKKTLEDKEEKVVKSSEDEKYETEEERERRIECDTNRKKKEDEINTDIQTVRKKIPTSKADVTLLPAKLMNRKVAPQLIKKRPRKTKANLQPSQAQLKLFENYFSGTRGRPENAKGLGEPRQREVISSLDKSPGDRPGQTEEPRRQPEEQN